jgi:tape measure domain-containing protein
MATLSTNDIKIRYDIDLSKLQQATSEFDKITAEERKLLNELGKLKKQFDDVGGKAKKAGKDAGDSMSGLSQIISKVGPVVAGVFAADKIINFTKAVINTTIQFESLRKSINFTSGSIEAGAANMQFLRDVSNRLGISLEAAASGFKAISASATQAGYSNLQTQRIFENVSKAVAAFGLSSDDAAGVFRALSQIISKGTVQAEELRGQIGDRIPGAFSIAAKAIGVTERELNKMMASGKVTAAEFVIPFTEALGKMSEQASTLDSMGKGFQRFSNAWQKMMETLGRQIDENVGIGRFVNALTRTLDYLATSTQTAMQEQEKAMAKGFQSVINSEISIYDKAQKEKIKIVVQTQYETTRIELEAVKQKQQARQKELDTIKGFHPYQKQFLRDTIKSLDDEISKLTLKESTLKGQLKAYDELLKTQKNINEAIQDPKALKAEYEQSLKILELLKQMRILEGELRNDPLARLGAEKAFLEAKLNLQRRYGALFVKEELDVTKLQVQVATKEFETGANRQLIIRKEANVKILEEDKNLYDKRLAEMKKWQKAYEQSLDDEAKKRKEAEDEKQRRIQATIELASTLTNGFTNLYTARIDNEITALNRRAEEEIRLADGNQQKIDEINQRKAQKERELKTKAWKAEQAAAIARVIFETASIVAKWASNPVTLPLAALTLANQAVQIGFIAAQPVPEFAEGTKGKPFEGGKAIVGERGVEKVVTESGKVYFTPATATLVDLPKGSQVIPNHALSRQELFLAGHYANKSSSGSSPVVGKLDELSGILKSLPITQLNMDERGFEKFIRTPRRTTKILNNRFRNSS